MADEERSSFGVAPTDDTPKVGPTSDLDEEKKSDLTNLRELNSSLLLDEQIVPQRLQQRAMSRTMEKVASLMREQDADLLESNHATGPNHSGMTPTLSAAGDLNQHPKVSPLALDDLCESPRRLRDASTDAGQNLLSLFRSVESDDVDGEKRDKKLDDFSLRRESFVEGRPLLSGEVFEDEPRGVVESSGTLRRTESKERRINEAAQFADAVGDVPLKEQEELRIIDDDDDDAAEDDDEDEDATEIHVARRGMSRQQHLNDVPDENISTPIRVPQRLPKDATAAPPIPEDSTQTKSFGSNTESIGRSSVFLTQLPSTFKSQDFVYKGIMANPPEIVKRGTARGNYAQLHRKAWLEVSDKYHRYGKNLRMYYRFWESVGCPTNMFFDWLDSKGEAAGQPLPEIPACPRSQLDSDTVRYILNPDVTARYALQVAVDEVSESEDDEEICRSCRILDVSGSPVQTGPEGWIFVLRDNVLYGTKKVTEVAGHSKERFHHSSFFGGKAVASAGIIITDENGYMTKLYPHSGHYRPGEAHVQRILFFMYHQGVDLRSFEMDMQQILHVSRDVKLPSEKTDTKKKKTESLHLMSAVIVACFLANKARYIGEGTFSQIHRIRKMNVTTVTEALEAIDDGGHWHRSR